MNSGDEGSRDPTSTSATTFAHALCPTGAMPPMSLIWVRMRTMSMGRMLNRLVVLFQSSSNVSTDYIIDGPAAFRMVPEALQLRHVSAHMRTFGDVRASVAAFKPRRWSVS